MGVYKMEWEQATTGALVTQCADAVMRASVTAAGSCVTDNITASCQPTGQHMSYSTARHSRENHVIQQQSCSANRVAAVWCTSCTILTAAASVLCISSEQLAAAVLTVADYSLSHLDLRQHAAHHPRLGVLDHVSMHPLGPDCSLQMAAQAAISLGRQLAAAPYMLPVYYYGAAHHAGRNLQMSGGT